MAIIPQMSLFTWKEVDELGDLERLRLVFEYMPDEELMKSLERERGKGRNDYPVHAMWNSVLAGIVFQHESIEKLRRELSRNGQLRDMCGVEGQVPSPWSYTQFLKKLMDHITMIDEMFLTLVNQLSEWLPDFGKHLAMDSKAISSFSKQKNKTISCVCPETGKMRVMCNGGFERDRSTLKKLCPAKQMGITCEGQAQCPIVQGIRIPLSEDRRIFTPIDRSSYKWKREYNKRTAVERVNSRLDVSFGFELHTIRGMNKMKL